MAAEGATRTVGFVDRQFDGVEVVDKDGPLLVGHKGTAPSRTRASEFLLK